MKIYAIFDFSDKHYDDLDFYVCTLERDKDGHLFWRGKMVGLSTNNAFIERCRYLGCLYLGREIIPQSYMRKGTTIWDNFRENDLEAPSL